MVFYVFDMTNNRYHKFQPFSNFDYIVPYQFINFNNKIYLQGSDTNFIAVLNFDSMVIEKFDCTNLESNPIDKNICDIFETRLEKEREEEDQRRELEYER